MFRFFLLKPVIFTGLLRNCRSGRLKKRGRFRVKKCVLKTALYIYAQKIWHAGFFKQTACLFCLNEKAEL